MARLEETVRRLHEPIYTVNGKQIHITNELELSVIDTLSKIDNIRDRPFHTAIQWLIHQVKTGKVPLCNK